MTARKLGRPMLEYKAERNGQSIKVFRRGVYLGSFSIRELGEMLEAKNNKPPS